MSLTDSYRVLGNYQLPDLSHFLITRHRDEAITAALKNILLNNCLKAEDIHGREPGFVATVPPEYGPDGWHHDGDSNVTSHVKYIAVWSNVQPTQLRYSMEDFNAPFNIFSANPGDFVLINNHRMYHRQPPWTVDPDRIFYRAWNIQEIGTP